MTTLEAKELLKKLTIDEKLKLYVLLTSIPSVQQKIEEDDQANKKAIYDSISKTERMQ